MLCERCQRRRCADGQQSGAGGGGQRQSGPPRQVSARSDRLLDPAVGHCGHQSAAKAAPIFCPTVTAGSRPETNTMKGQCQRYQEYDLAPRNCSGAMPSTALTPRCCATSREQREERPGDGDQRDPAGNPPPPFTRNTVPRIIVAPIMPPATAQVPDPRARPFRRRQRQKATGGKLPRPRGQLIKSERRSRRGWPEPRRQTSPPRALPGSKPGSPAASEERR